MLERETRLYKTNVDARLTRCAPLAPVFEFQRRKLAKIVSHAEDGPAQVQQVRHTTKWNIRSGDVNVFESVIRFPYSCVERQAACGLNVKCLTVRCGQNPGIILRSDVAKFSNDSRILTIQYDMARRDPLLKILPGGKIEPVVIDGAADLQSI